MTTEIIVLGIYILGIIVTTIIFNLCVEVDNFGDYGLFGFFSLFWPIIAFIGGIGLVDKGVVELIERIKFYYCVYQRGKTTKNRE